MALRKTSITQKRRKAVGLLVCRDADLNSRLRQALNALGYAQISSVTTHVQALDRMKTRRFDFIFFDAIVTNMPMTEFVLGAKTLDPDAIPIALSAQPQIDDVFELLRAGARGVVVLPFNSDTLEEAIEKAVDGPPFSDAVLEAKDRDAALAGLILNNLYRLTSAMRYLRTYSGAITEVELHRHALHESVDLAQTFSKHGDIAIRDKICDACLIRSETASTRLGRTRQRLKQQRNKVDPGIILSRLPRSP